MKQIRIAAGFLLVLFSFIVLFPLAASMVVGAEGGENSTFYKEKAVQRNDVCRPQLPSKIKVFREKDGKAMAIDFEDYVACVVAGEMPSSFGIEALKAQAVAARTFAIAKVLKYDEKKPLAHPETPICDTTHCQVFKTEQELIDCHPKGWKADGWKKVKKACKATEGQMLYYNGKLVMQPLFFSSSGGQTENSEDVFVSAVPYLVSVSSPYEDNATHRNEEKSMSIEEFWEKITTAFPDKNFGEPKAGSIKILSRTAGGRVDDMKIGNDVVRGTAVRNALGLSSTLFSVSFEEGDKIVFTSNGSGHGVGMSQYGADGMAQNGSSYIDILKHYYSGTEVY